MLVFRGVWGSVGHIGCLSFVIVGLVAICGAASTAPFFYAVGDLPLLSPVTGLEETRWVGGS